MLMSNEAWLKAAKSEETDASRYEETENVVSKRSEGCVKRVKLKAVF